VGVAGNICLKMDSGIEKFEKQWYKESEIRASAKIVFQMCSPAAIPQWL
jgi:hypothetical protein